MKEVKKQRELHEGLHPCNKKKSKEEEHIHCKATTNIKDHDSVIYGYWKRKKIKNVTTRDQECTIEKWFIASSKICQNGHHRNEILKYTEYYTFKWWNTLKTM